MVKLELQEIEIWRTNAAEADAAFCLVQEYFEVVGVVVREDREKFIEEYFGEGRGFWLAKMDGELAGCIGLRRLPRSEELELEDVKCAEIKRMYVREKFRGRGIGKALLASVARIAQQENCYAMRWEVLNWNRPAIELYQSMGGTFLDQWRSVLLKDEALRRLAEKAR